MQRSERRARRQARPSARTGCPSPPTADPAARKAVVFQRNRPKCSAPASRPARSSRRRHPRFGDHLPCIHCQADQQPIAETRQQQRSGPEDPGAQAMIDPASEKDPEQRWNHDCPAQRADLREIAPERRLALAQPILMPDAALAHRVKQAIRLFRHPPTSLLTLRAQCGDDPPHRLGVQPRRSDPPGPFGLRLGPKPGHDRDLQSVKVVAELRFARGDRNLVAAPHRQHAAAHRAIAGLAVCMPPGDNRDRQNCQQIGMTPQDTEAAAFVLGAQAVTSAQSATIAVGSVISSLMWSPPRLRIVWRASARLPIM